MKTAKKPLIGITLDSEPGGGYSPMPWYALRENYADAVSKWGGVPILLPHEPSHVETYLSLIDGIILTGGNFDVDPSLYGANERHMTVTTKEKRTLFEMRIAKAMLAAKKPLLGICGGEQLINVVLGGTLIQHIPDSIKDALPHEQANPRTEPGHSVAVHPGTRLHAIVRKDTIEVNTSHHQAVDRVAPGVIVNAVAPDGVIEGIEYPDHPFCIGVQWHPEYEVTGADSALIAALIEAA